MNSASVSGGGQNRPRASLLAKGVGVVGGGGGLCFRGAMMAHDLVQPCSISNNKAGGGPGSSDNAPQEHVHRAKDEGSGSAT